MRVFAVLSVLFIGLFLTEQTLAQGFLDRIRDRIRSGYDFARQAGQGTRDMYRAYRYRGINPINIILYTKS